ncbi:hypothetical protein [Clostridium paridis]|uniref:LITAF domain-containing protein n=1 Tax=Clostridium paridis TaxID=2803863 RepID=A0A937FHI9_9CLOT|nr:hypothetical protein [Clostridium paridis]MBL4932133.1 hypothetical protein [Clostridium paridis]
MNDEASNYSQTSCPFCNSKNVQVIIEKETNDYDAPSGCLGYICLGPIGLLCGLCAAEGTKTTTTCICNNCGKRFSK